MADGPGDRGADAVLAGDGADAAPAASASGRPPTITDRVERIVALDVLRGLALLGMILVHFHQGFRLTTPEIALWPGEGLSEWVIWWGIEGKAAATYALLFGVGFAVILRRAEASDRPIMAFYLRRMLFLALLGLVVEALTGYTILVALATFGVWLLLFRGFRPGALLALAVASAIAVPLYHLGAGVIDVVAGAGPIGTAAPPTAVPTVPPPQTYAQEVGARVLGPMRDAYGPGWSWLLPTQTLTLFLVGMAALRAGVIEDPRRHLRLVTGAMLFGAVSWALYWLVLPVVPAAWFGWSRHAYVLRTGLGLVQQEWLAFTYAGAVLLLLAYRPRWTARLSAAGVAGRLGLTNYVAQAAIIYWLKSEFGLGLALRPYGRVVAALGLFGALALFSHAWLSRFQYGPLEWTWRAFSRWSVPALRRPAPALCIRSPTS